MKTFVTEVSTPWAVQLQYGEGKVALYA